MLRTIFSKILWFYLILIMVSMVAIGVLMYWLIGRYVTEQRASDLRNYASNISMMTSIAMMTVDGPNPFVSEVIFRNFRNSVESVAENTKTVIMTVDVEGKLFYRSQRNSVQISEEHIKPELFKETLSGSNSTTLGNFGGVYHQVMLNVGVPIKYEDGIIGAVYMSIPVPELNRSRTDVLYIIFSTLIVGAVISIALSFVLSRKISSPIKEINAAARAISKGDFETRVNVRSNDEIGELSVTFNKMIESLQNTEMSRRSFVANVSHELRTPMTSIAGFIEGVLDGTIPAQQHQKYLGVALSESKRLSRLVTDLLEMSRMDNEGIQLSFSVFDINELVRVTLIKFERRILEKNIAVNVEFCDEQSMVMADRDAIERVLTNLVDNAVKFTDEDGHIAISVYYSNSLVNVAVKNSGAGLTADELRKIWERFYKTDESRSLDKRGVGLGLFLVKNIVHRHGQSIWADSKPSSYTRFTFTIKKA